MKRFLIAALLSLTLMTSAIPARAADVSDVFNKVLRSLVTVGYNTDDDKTHFCAGFVIDAAKGWVLTAAHCVELGKDIYVNEEPSTIIKVKDAFALVSIPVMSKPRLELSNKVPSLGTPVIVSGYAYAISGMTVFSRVIANKDHDDFGVDGPLAEGMSGGPIVNEDGKVIGMNQASTNAIGIACGVDEIRAFLKGVK